MSQYIKRSALTGQKYDMFDDVITIINPSQAAYYVDKGLCILDVRLGNDRSTGHPILLFLFKKSDTKEIFDEWCKRGEKNG